MEHECLGRLCKCKTPGKSGFKSKATEGPTRYKKDIVHAKGRATAMEGEVAKGYKNAGFNKARRVPMSGAINTLPADVDPGELLLVECKMSRTGKVIIQPSWIHQVRKQSQDAGRTGYYALHSWVAEGDSHYYKAVVVDEGLWFEVLRSFKECEKELHERQS